MPPHTVVAANLRSRSVALPARYGVDSEQAYGLECHYHTNKQKTVWLSDKGLQQEPSSSATMHQQ